MSKSSKKPATTAGAAALIAAAQAKAVSTPDLTPEQLAELTTIVNHNDSAGLRTRVPARSTLDLLGQLGWTGRSKRALDHVCQKQLGRTSFGTR